MTGVQTCALPISLILITSYLLVCEMPLFALKFKQWGFKGNEVKYGFAALTLKNKYRAWLEVEILADEAWAELGEIPKEDVALIREKADFDIDRILEIEQQTRHDVVAFTRAVSETLGEERKWVHYGLTSTDVVDTAYGYL